jgi:hypothetical protein
MRAVLSYRASLKPVRAGRGPGAFSGLQRRKVPIERARRGIGSIGGTLRRPRFAATNQRLSNGFHNPVTLPFRLAFIRDRPALRAVASVPYPTDEQAVSSQRKSDAGRLVRAGPWRSRCPAWNLNEHSSVGTH